MNPIQNRRRDLLKTPGNRVVTSHADGEKRRKSVF